MHKATIVYSSGDVNSGPLAFVCIDKIRDKSRELSMIMGIVGMIDVTFFACNLV